MGIKVDKALPLAVLCAACFFIGRLTCRVHELGKRIDIDYPAITKELDGLTERMIKLNVKASSIQDEITDLGTCFSNNS
jgi:hypothetical protein